ncbi:hypothetical protein C8F01DRAFT_1000384 [Mycena amicta]|nr:hypothetical protein C8F01DRAFT_1000384 [Mycena amicta]
MSDFKLRELPGDIELNGQVITNIEHADDVLTPSSLAASFQVHLNEAQLWCNRNGCETSIPKCLVQNLGKKSRAMPVFEMNGQPLSQVDTARYLGLLLTSKGSFMWKEQYISQTKSASKASNVILTLDRFLGDVPAWDLRTLYIAMVDPYLIAGCEIVLDVTKKYLKMLEKIQRRFIRRMLGVGSRSLIAVLFSETGLWPIRYRRVYLALKNLCHLLELENDQRPAWNALQESLTLARAGHSCWAKDLCTVLSELFVPVALDISQPLDVPTVQRAMAAVKDSMEAWIDDEINKSERVKDLLSTRLEFDSAERKLRYTSLAFRHYLRVKTAAHRQALTRMILSSHSLAVERRRWTERRKPKVPREWRLCRFCKTEVEDPAHAMFMCSHPPLEELREIFLAKLYADVPEIKHNVAARLYDSPASFFAAVLVQRETTPLLAKLAFNVLKIYDAVPMYAPLPPDYPV